jgi:16S rRNA (guanine966-N2)-methyltransferase
MRIIGGSAKGRELRGPKASKGHIRPTSDKVRGALFDILAAHLEDARVLDLYAGTGALAIEALSRGAQAADLVEADHEAQRLIADNLARAGLDESADVWRMPVEKALPLLRGQYDVILADPPYADAHIMQLLASVAPLLSERGFIVIEHASRVSLPDEASSLKLWKRRRHGDTTLSIYSRELAA